MRRDSSPHISAFPIYLELLVVLSIVFPRVADADRCGVPDWGEISSQVVGDELWVTGISSSARTWEQGRQIAFKNALREIRNFSQINEDALAELTVSTKMTCDEPKPDKTFMTFRLVTVKLADLQRSKSLHKKRRTSTDCRAEKVEVSIVTMNKETVFVETWGATQFAPLVSRVKKSGTAFCKTEKYLLEGEQRVHSEGCAKLSVYITCAAGETLRQRGILMKIAQASAKPPPAPAQDTFADRLDVVRKMVDEGEFTQALGLLDQLLSVHPQDAEALLLRGILKYQNGAYREARSDLHASLRIRPSHESYYYAGAVEEAAENLEDAENYYSSAVDLRDDYSIAFLGRGRVRLQRGKRFMAIEDLNRAIKFGRRNSDAYNLRGLALLAASEAEYPKVFDAIENFDKAINIDPEQPLYFYNRMMGEVRARRFQEAITDANQALKLGLFPKYSAFEFSFYTAVARARCAVGETEAALNAANIAYTLERDEGLQKQIEILKQEGCP